MKYGHTLIDGYHAVTVDMMARRCCCYSRSRLKRLWKGRKYVTCHDVCDMKIPLKDKVWFATQIALYTSDRVYNNFHHYEIPFLMWPGITNVNQLRGCIDMMEIFDWIPHITMKDLEKEN